MINCDRQHHHARLQRQRAVVVDPADTLSDGRKRRVDAAVDRREVRHHEPSAHRVHAPLARRRFAERADFKAGGCPTLSARREGAPSEHGNRCAAHHDPPPPSTRHTGDRSRGGTGTDRRPVDRPSAMDRALRATPGRSAPLPRSAELRVAGAGDVVGRGLFRPGDRRRDGTRNVFSLTARQAVFALNPLAAAAAAFSQCRGLLLEWRGWPKGRAGGP